MAFPPRNSQTLNRYSYAIHSSILFTDPTGHVVCEDAWGDNCGPDPHSLSSLAKASTAYSSTPTPPGNQSPDVLEQDGGQSGGTPIVGTQVPSPLPSSAPTPPFICPTPSSFSGTPRQCQRTVQSRNSYPRFFLYGISLSGSGGIYVEGGMEGAFDLGDLSNRATSDFIGEGSALGAGGSATAYFGLASNVKISS